MKKTIGALLGFAAFIIISAVLYQALKERTETPNNMTFTGGEIAADTEAESNSDAENMTSASELSNIQTYDFTVIDTDGNECRLSDLIGKPLVLNFWASWCPPCKQEMPEFQEVFDEMQEDVNFMMVDLTDGQRETVEKGTKHVADNNYSFPVYFDTKQEAAMMYSITSIPMTVFIDKDGYIIAIAQGAIDKETLLAGIGHILPEENP